MSEIKLKIVDASYHRNGVCGEGFWAILFDDEENGRMIASLFDGDGRCAVYSVPMLAEGNIKFAQGNSWRGDQFESVLRPALRKWTKRNGCNRVGPFAFPQN